MDNITMGHESGCWEWIGPKTKAGYSQFCIGKERFYGHRVSYEEFIGPIPDGLQIDHLCRNPSCINPWHLEPVTGAENVRRGMAGEAARIRCRAQTQCKYGHPFSGDNLYVDANGYRICRTCQRIASRRARAIDAGENHWDTESVSLRNKTHCPQGHPFEGENVMYNSEGYRICRTCRLVTQHRYNTKSRAKQREVKAASRDASAAGT